MSPELYVALRHSHLGLVSLSVALFALRGLGALSGAAWPLRPAARGLSVAIDVVLLLTGVSLAVGLQVSQAWLPVKLGWLVAYIGLGSLALKRAPTRAAKALAFVLALGCVTMLVGVARAHHPLGWFA
ncbi:SirB2 family protein [Inhella gelatinilytica]|uniref:SirB2 family protein n=1 Tax=Inhella gelatinilytica TaxID=2795030 RepID=UPI002872ECE7|nr:SirB2 family protein [Inhella gelatinilytica]